MRNDNIKCEGVQKELILTDIPKDVVETKICKKCGRILPVDKFRLVRGQFYNPYYLGQCKECEYKYQREYLEEKNKVEFSDNLEILIERHYKEIRTERILDISNLKIIPLGT